MSNTIDHYDSHDGVDRRGFLKCMAWAGAGLVWAMQGGVLRSRAFGADTADARSTAFPQPEPGKAESPWPMKNVAAEKLKSYLGLTRVDYVEHGGTLAIVDSSLE